MLAETTKLNRRLRVGSVPAVLTTVALCTGRGLAIAAPAQASVPGVLLPSWSPLIRSTIGPVPLSVRLAPMIRLESSARAYPGKATAQCSAGVDTRFCIISVAHLREGQVRLIASLDAYIRVEDALDGQRRNHPRPVMGRSPRTLSSRRGIGSETGIPFRFGFDVSLV